MNSSLMENRYCPILNKIGTCQQSFMKTFRDDPFRESRFVSCVSMDGESEFRIVSQRCDYA
jgi:hypothetical protein